MTCPSLPRRGIANTRQCHDLSRIESSIKIYISIKTFLGATVLTLLFLIACSDINTVNDPHFEPDGTYIPDSIVSIFKPQPPTKVKFYVEVSGSMNGFFRANAPTKFKSDVWRILTYYSPIANNITILTNDGTMGQSFPLANNSGK